MAAASIILYFCLFYDFEINQLLATNVFNSMLMTRREILSAKCHVKTKSEWNLGRLTADGNSGTLENGIICFHDFSWCVSHFVLRESASCAFDRKTERWLMLGSQISQNANDSGTQRSFWATRNLIISESWRSPLWFECYLGANRLAYQFEKPLSHLNSKSSFR